MGAVIQILQWVGFSAKQIQFLLFSGILGVGIYVWNVFNGRFIKYRENNGIEIIKDRKLDNEYIIYKNRQIK